MKYFICWLSYLLSAFQKLRIDTPVFFIAIHSHSLGW